MSDILLIETDDLGILRDLKFGDFKGTGIEKVVVVPPIASLGDMAIERLKEHHALIHKLIDEE